MSVETPKDFNDSKSELPANASAEKMDLPSKVEADKESSDFDQMMQSMPSDMRGMFMRMTHTGPLPDPVVAKITPEHIDKLLDYTHQEELNAYKISSSNRWFQLIYFLAALVFLAFVIVYLAPQHKDLLTEILKLLIIFAGGVGAGFGWNSFMGRKK